MSIRRAVEAHVKLSTEAFKGTFPHTYVESLRNQDRPLPGVIVMAGAADPAFDNQPDSLSNWNVPVTILVMSSIDDTTIDQHSELVNTISNVMSLPSSRKYSKIEGLYIYNIAQSNIAHENQGRRMTAIMNFNATVNYKPITGWSE